MSMGKIDPNHDIVPTLRMMGGLLFDKAADEIDLLREAYRAAVRRPATELMVVGPGWHERFPVTTTPIVIDGLLQVHVSARRDDMAAELARLRAENERLTGALQEIANTPTSPDNHDLVAVIMLAQYALRDDAPTAPPAR